MGLKTTINFESNVLQIHLYTDKGSPVGNITIEVFPEDCYADKFKSYTTKKKFLKTFKNERIAWVTFVYVQLPYRYNGYSKILINGAIEWLINFGITNFALEVAPACTISKTALADYYSTFGFEFLSRTSNNLIMFLRK